MKLANKLHLRRRDVLLTFCVLAATCMVQGSTHHDNAGASVHRAETTAATSDTRDRRLLTPADTQTWKVINTQRLSADGRWFAYFYGPEYWHDGEIVVKAIDSDIEYRFDIGPGPREVKFSDDSRFVAFTVLPLLRDRDKSKQPEDDVRGGARLLNLATGAIVDYPNVNRFEFANDTSYAFAVHRRRSDGVAPGTPSASKDRQPTSADLIVRDLRSGVEATIGNVAEFGFNKSGRTLAWTISAEEQVGNGISIQELETGAIRTLDSGRAIYEKLTWSAPGDALSVLKGAKDKAARHKTYSVVGAIWRSGDMTKVMYEPKEDATFPAGMAISPKRAPEWTGDRQGLLFGIEKTERSSDDSDPESKKESPSASLPALVLWHWKDVQQQSAQETYQNQLKARDYYLATFRLDQKRFIQLSDDSFQDVMVPQRGRWAIGFDHREYELLASLDGRQFQDVYIIDMNSGEKRLAIRRLRWFFSVTLLYIKSPMFTQSPDGEKVLFYRDGHYHILDAASGSIANITGSLPTSFVNTEADRDSVKPPVRPIGWATDSKSVLLSDAWDVWMIPVSGTGAQNLTANGRRDHIRYVFMDTDGDDTGVDLSMPMYYRMLDEPTKKGGIARSSPGKSGAEVLAWEDAVYRSITRAKRTDRVIYARESRQDYPDVFVADTSLKGPRRLTNGQEQIAPLAWASDARLLNFTSDGPTGVKGTKMQAALYLPANYQPGRRYPTIVHIYEKLSDQLNQFDEPRFYGFMRTYYTNHGYAVLTPDVNFTRNDPGMSAVWCVLPALKAAIDTGVVDSARVGLHGYSWGAYQASFLVTQTNAFKAAVVAAGLTDMVSLYGLLYGGTGNSMATSMESGQIRFNGPFWDHWDAYLRNSPIVHVSKVQTPVLLMHNDKDDAAPFAQGLEFFNALRKQRKPVAMLQYVGDRHVLTKLSHRLDMTMRVQEFFDHHLQDAPAPDWWKQGVPRSEMQQHLKARMGPAAKSGTGVPADSAGSAEGRR